MESYGRPQWINEILKIKKYISVIGTIIRKSLVSKIYKEKKRLLPASSFFARCLPPSLPDKLWALMYGSIVEGSKKDKWNGKNILD